MAGITKPRFKVVTGKRKKEEQQTAKMKQRKLVQEEAAKYTSEIVQQHTCEGQLLPIVQTSEPITVEPIEDVIERRKLNKRAATALKKNRIIITVDKTNPNFFCRNDMDGYYPFKTRFIRFTNLTHLIFKHGLWARILPHCSPAQLVSEMKACPSLVLAQFLLYPQSWLSDKNQVSALTDTFQVDQTLCNTSKVEQDTSFPQLTSGVGAVVLGLPEAIAKHLNGALSYAEACNDVIMKVFHASNGTLEENALSKRSNDFPVLAAIDTHRVISSQGNTHVIDFFEETKQLGQPLVPLFLTTCTEVMSRIHLQYLELLYGFGCVELDPTPLDESKSLYQLSDKDTVTVKMHFTRSNVMLYSVNVACSSCYASHNDMWQPGIEAKDQQWLEDVSCKACGKQVINKSCFLMKESPSRTMLDPACTRQISYNTSWSRKKGAPLPTGVPSSSHLPRYEHVCEFTNGSNLRLHVRQDVKRKNQRTKAISTTIFVPVTFSSKRTAESMRTELQAAGLEVDEITPDTENVVPMHIFVGEKEHIIPMVCTRLKLSFSCNKVISVDVKRENVDLVRLRTAHLSDTFQLQVNKKGDAVLTVHFPNSQSSKRIGVQTRDTDGNIEPQKSTVIVEQPERINHKKQPALHVNIETSMYTAINFWMRPDWEKRENNFLRFGPTMVSGLVYNLISQAEATMEDTDGIPHLLKLVPMGRYGWCDLDNLLPKMGTEVAGALYNKCYVQSKVLKQELDEKNRQIKEKQSHIDRLMKEKAKVSLLQDQLKAITKERDDLLQEKAETEKQLEMLQSNIDHLQDLNKDLTDKFNCLEEKMGQRMSELERKLSQKNNMEEKFDQIIDNLGEETEFTLPEINFSDIDFSGLLYDDLFPLANDTVNPCSPMIVAAV